MGAAYSWGSSNPGVSFDCSGLTQYAYKQVGIDLPRTSGQQVDAGTQISKSEAQPGDLVVWPGHMGIYAGDNMMIAAPRTGTARGMGRRVTSHRDDGARPSCRRSGRRTGRRDQGSPERRGDRLSGPRRAPR